ncbi:RNA-directed DNA polymerase, eukaryota, reverse transcriptase zinc-binding domain protein, partial [Tanacetum coccineum]
MLSWQNGNVFDRVISLKEQLVRVQAEVDTMPHDKEVKERSCKIPNDYNEAMRDEYTMLMHKSRVMTICNEKGERFENDRVAEQFLKHFQEFLGKQDEVIEIPSDRIVFPNKLSTEEADRMCRSVNEVEVKNAMFDIDDSKALGPDGYTARFYKSAWSIIGKDVCKAIPIFFVTGRLLGEVNATLISLIPKIQTPDKVSDFRPIACCNVLYKCISKIITNRLKGVLGKLVHESQSAFVAGRQKTDNILLSQELFRGYNRKQKQKKVAFKIDLQKAYDTISWEFLKNILLKFGFPSKMVNWIMTCVSTTKFSISINGDRLEVLNLIVVKNIEDNGDFKSSVETIGNSLEEFSNYSGLKANMNKSTVFFGGMTEAEQRLILDIVPFLIGRLPV